MTLVLNEEQRLLKDTAREFLGEHSPVSALRQLRDSKDETGYSQSLWSQMTELGWAAMVLPEDYDGLGFGFMGLGAVMEECGRTLTASPLFSTVVLGASAIALGGSDRQKADILPAIASGNLSLALALEEGIHHSPTSIALSAIADGDSFVLDGVKQFVLDGHSADKLVVVARSYGEPGDTDGLSLFLVESNSPGVNISRRIMADSRNAAQISFDKVHVGHDALIGEFGQAWPILDTVLDRGRICLAAEMLGGSLECLERTVEYLKEREQFGVKIGTFQALKHRAAILYSEVQLSRSLVMDALSAIDDDRRNLGMAASAVKAKLNDVYMLVTNEATQMHGGIGVTDELEIGFFLKRARMAIQLLGDSHFHRDRYATLNGY